MKDLPNSLVDNPAELSSFDLEATAQAAVEDLDARGFKVLVGLNEAYAEQIMSLCHEDAILEYCPNDAGSRFTDLAAAKTWVAKQRAIFLLVEKDSGKLAGYGWVGEEDNNQEVKDGKTTWAIRISQNYQGQGLATPYAKAIVFGGRSIYGLDHIWLASWASNPAAIHVYGKLGFVEAVQVSTDRKDLQGETVHDSRIYMYLPED